MADQAEARELDDAIITAQAIGDEVDDYYPIQTLCRRVGSHEMAVIVPRNSRRSWMVDSGATTHYVNDLSYFKTYHILAHRPMMTLADGQGSPAVGAGTVELHLLREDGRVAMRTLTNVYYTPEGTCNLLSLASMERETRVRLRHEHVITLRRPDGVDMGHVVRHEMDFHLIPSPDHHHTDNEIRYPCPHAEAVSCEWYTTVSTEVGPHAVAHSRHLQACPLRRNKDCHADIPPDELAAHIKERKLGSYESPRVVDIGLTRSSIPRFCYWCTWTEHITACHLT